MRPACGKRSEVGGGGFRLGGSCLGILERGALGVVTRRFVDGEDRMQQALLPNGLEDYVGAENPARVIASTSPSLPRWGFGDDADGGTAGLPSPTLVKIYLYGCLNRVQSSRRLEREAQRNIELRGPTGQPPTSAGIMTQRAELVCGRFVEPTLGLSSLPAPLLRSPAA